MEKGGQIMARDGQIMEKGGQIMEKDGKIMEKGGQIMGKWNPTSVPFTRLAPPSASLCAASLCVIIMGKPRSR